MESLVLSGSPPPTSEFTIDEERLLRSSTKTWIGKRFRERIVLDAPTAELWRRKVHYNNDLLFGAIIPEDAPVLFRRSQVFVDAS